MFAPPQFPHLQPMQTAKGPTQEERKQQYYQICSTIVPIIAQAIDEAGGLCSLGELGKDQSVIDAMATIPVGFSKKIKNAIDLFPDFISCFDGGRVATAKAYDDGLVNKDGTINKDLVKKAKKGEHPELQAPPMGRDVAQDSYSMDGTGMREPPEVAAHNFGMMGKRLQEACMRGTDEVFAAAMEEARYLRYRQSSEAQDEAKRVIIGCIRSIVASGKQSTLSLVATRPEVLELRPIIGRKVKKFLDEHTDTFTIREVPHENGGPHQVLVVDVNPMAHVPEPARNPVAQVLREYNSVVHANGIAAGKRLRVA